MKSEHDYWYTPVFPGKTEEEMKKEWPGYPWNFAGSWTWHIEGSDRWYGDACYSREGALKTGSYYAEVCYLEDFTPDAKILTGRREKGDKPHHYKIVDIESHTRLKDGGVPVINLSDMGDAADRFRRKELLDNLENLAKSATPGPWTTEEPKMDDDGFWDRASIASASKTHVYTLHNGGLAPFATINYIAALSPEVVLELIAMARLAATQYQ